MEEGPWYCSCGGQLNTYVAIGSWRLHRDQFIDLLIISFCALLLAVVSNPTSDRLGTPCLRNQRDWVVKWLYLWLLSRAYVCLNGMGLALKSGVWVVAEFSEVISVLYSVPHPAYTRGTVWPGHSNSC